MGLPGGLGLGWKWSLSCRPVRGGSRRLGTQPLARVGRCVEKPHAHYCEGNLGSKWLRLGAWEAQPAQDMAIQPWTQPWTQRGWGFAVAWPGPSLPGFIPVMCQQRPHFCLLLHMGKARLIAGKTQGQAAGVVKSSKLRGRAGLGPAMPGPAMLGHPSAGLGPRARLDGQVGVRLPCSLQGTALPGALLPHREPGGEVPGRPLGSSLGSPHFLFLTPLLTSLGAPACGAAGWWPPCGPGTPGSSFHACTVL